MPGDHGLLARSSIVRVPAAAAVDSARPQREKVGTPVVVGAGKGGKGVPPPPWKTVYAKINAAATKTNEIGQADITDSWLAWGDSGTASR
ncbi:hypothetical protein [Streptacidiphilus sp. P02-A3a]|uniref:hypothetical protein n=1 Tax=Streptacidiphilus sp. P02-A3a TaxID=2704468 RepID=UPI0015FCC788|nr:hypothetical protein [Streptacidiphilus sp. P02-A3a]QMU73222.1 hypothetical protein GXP74_38315 [Streptacidiphilus sp. P02-A3a]